MDDPGSLEVIDPGEKLVRNLVSPKNIIEVDRSAGTTLLLVRKNKVGNGGMNHPIPSSLRTWKPQPRPETLFNEVCVLTLGACHGCPNI